MDNKQIAFFLKEIAVYKELVGDNPFKIRSFTNAARVIETTTENIKTCVKNGTLTELKGIGQAISKVIEELVLEGTSSELEELKQKVPEGIPELLSLSGMGPKKVRVVWKNLGITSIGELEYACRENRLLTLEGFGELSQNKILKAIEYKKKYRGSFLYHEAYIIAASLISFLESSGLFKKATLVGSLRRGKKYVKDVDILVVPHTEASLQQIKDTLISQADNIKKDEGIIASGDTKVSIRSNGLQVDFRIIEKDSYPTALQHFTGSKEHNTILRQRAKSFGLKQNEYGIFSESTKLEVADEEDVYRHLKLSWIPPEIREGAGEVIAAEKNNLPQLINISDIKGIIHVHTNYSDGSNSIDELASECIKRGFSYLCITDHSKSAYYAGGLSDDKLKSQIAEIHEINEKISPFRIFCGIESDILPDGSLDYPDDILARLDFVIGSIHSKLSMGQEEATKRLVSAINNPYLTILGHISGRLLLSREGYPYSEEEILNALEKNNVVLEHNCNPYRLDPDWEFLKKARERGILVCLSPDVHNLDSLSDIHFGHIMARKGWLEKKNILNCMTGEEIDEYFKNRKKKKGL